MNGDGWSGGDASSVFLWHLAALPLDTWSRVRTDGLTDRHRMALVIAKAWCAMPARAVAEWSLRDDLETIGHHVRALSMHSTLTHAQVDRMLRATEGAARGLLVRSDLESWQFEVLYAPFADVLPLTRVVSSVPAEEASAPSRSRSM